MAGDLLVEAAYTDYKDFGGLKVPGRIVQKRAGLQTFEATITAAQPRTPHNLTAVADASAAGAGAWRRAGAAPAGTAGAAAGPGTEAGDGVYRITGGYAALAVDMGDHIVVARRRPERGARSGGDRGGEAGDPEQADPLRRQLAPALRPRERPRAALSPKASTILTHDNNEEFLEKLLGSPRTLVGDALAKANRKPNVEGVGDRTVLKGAHPARIELHHVKDLEHSDGMLIAYLPKEKILFTGDFNIPAANQPAAPAINTLVQNVERLKLDFDAHVLVHAPNPDKPQTKADLLALAKRSTN